MDQEILQHLRKDKVLKNLVENISLPSPRRSGEVYPDLLSSIISQQLSGKVATVILERFLNLFASKNPEPTLLMQMDIEELRKAGLSGQKASYLKNVAEFFIQEGLMKKDFQKMDNEEIIGLLTQIKGVGKWTVEMILMFTLGRPDVFPIDDYGIRSAMIELYGVEGSGKKLKSQLESIAQKWTPYRTYACYYLWRYKDNK